MDATDPALTLVRALQEERLREFVDQEEARGVPSADAGDLRRALAAAAAQRRWAGSTTRSGRGA